MKTTRYLYDIEPQILAEMKYKDAIEFKITCAKELLYHLVHVKNEVLTKRVKDIQKAIDFNIALREELKSN